MVRNQCAPKFSLDVLAVAKHRSTSRQCHDFIGFDFFDNLLERAFPESCGTHGPDITILERCWSEALWAPAPLGLLEGIGR